MIRLALIFCVLTSFVYSQSTGEVWTEVGAKGEFSKKLDWSFELNNRFGQMGHEQFFPQASLKYKLKGGFKASLDYRLIFEKDKFTNYIQSNRFQINVQYKERVKRFDLEARVRYQYGFSHWSRNPYFDFEAKNTFRFKPQINYDIDNSILTPYVNSELFFGLDQSDAGQRFNKVRFGGGFDFELDAPFEVSIGYIYDQQVGGNSRDPRHIASFSLKYKIK